MSRNMPVSMQTVRLDAKFAQLTRSITNMAREPIGQYVTVVCERETISGTVHDTRTTGLNGDLYLLVEVTEGSLPFSGQWINVQIHLLKQKAEITVRPGNDYTAVGYVATSFEIRPSDDL